MSLITPEDIAPVSQGKMDDFFSEMVAALTADKFMLETNVASREKKKMYDLFINKNEAGIHGLARTSSSFFFIRGLVNDYISELQARQININKLALELVDNKMLVWAEVFDDDETGINELILAEAKINAAYSKWGFYISTTVVESCDELNIPDQYKSVDLSKLNWLHS